MQSAKDRSFAGVSRSSTLKASNKTSLNRLRRIQHRVAWQSAVAVTAQDRLVAPVVKTGFLHPITRNHDAGHCGGPAIFAECRPLPTRTQKSAKWRSKNDSTQTKADSSPHF